MNKWLHGNGHWCPSCRGTGRGRPRDRIGYNDGSWLQFYDRCETCRGAKRLPGPGDTPAPKHHTSVSQLMEYGRTTKGRDA
jgi:DnaJ-class molecular chaperone